MREARIVVIGSGAREHALVRALLRGAATGEPREVIAIPGNPGIAQEVRCAPASGGVEALAAAALAEKPDLVIVGPEAPLAAGLVDRLAAAGVACFGPTAGAAQIEASKAFAKEVMRAAGVPTASSAVFDDPGRARDHARSVGACVVKLDGLAAGKGVIVCDDGAQAADAVDELWGLGSAGGAGPGAPLLRLLPRLLIEERLTGPELSVLALCDGARALALPPARDHKQLLDGGKGPNTGGMGAVSPPRDAPDEAVQEILRAAVLPTLAELARRGLPFRGVLYAGLMLTPKGPRVLEFNCRFGDPEAQAILLRLRGDLLPALQACARGELGETRLEVDPRASVAVVLASAGYPAAPRPGDPIDGLDAVAQGEELQLLHAGTRAEGGRIVTAGGRVLTIAALGAGVAQARERAYAAAAQVSFAGMQLRRDVGQGEV